MFTMEQLVRDSREAGRSPKVAEVRETVRLVLTALERLHASSRTLSTHAPRHWMRFPAGWKHIAADCLQPMNAALDLTDLISVGDPLYRAPEFVSAIVGNRPSVSLTPAMDVWAVALICLELILPQPLFAATLANAAPPTGPSNDVPFAALAREQSAPIALPPEVGLLARVRRLDQGAPSSIRPCVRRRVGLKPSILLAPRCFNTRHGHSLDLAADVD